MRSQNVLAMQKFSEACANASGTVSGTRSYDAFGGTLSSTGWQGPAGYGGAFGYREDGTNFRLVGHRLYDPTAGRFLSRDPIRYGKNWYAYCGGDPVNLVDPEGLFYVTADVGVSGGAIIGGQAGEGVIFGPGGIQGQGGGGAGVGHIGGSAGATIGFDMGQPPAPGKYQPSSKLSITVQPVQVNLNIDPITNLTTGGGIGLGFGLGASITTDWQQATDVLPYDEVGIPTINTEPWWQPIRKWGDRLVKAIEDHVR